MVGAWDLIQLMMHNIYINGGDNVEKMSNSTFTYKSFLFRVIILLHFFQAVHYVILIPRPVLKSFLQKIFSFFYIYVRKTFKQDNNVFSYLRHIPPGYDEVRQHNKNFHNQQVEEESQIRGRFRIYNLLKILYVLRYSLHT